jgi:aminoglycoside/choline kinase family phosphotransferase
MILLGLFAGVYLAASRRFTKKSASSGTITRHTVKKPAADVLKYWTADKMHSARGVDLPKVDAPDQEQRPPHKPGPHQD